MFVASDLKHLISGEDLSAVLLLELLGILLLGEGHNAFPAHNRLDITPFNVEGLVGIHQAARIVINGLHGSDVLLDVLCKDDSAAFVAGLLLLSILCSYDKVLPLSLIHFHPAERALLFGNCNTGKKG